jgi:hypothetical protein
MKEQLKQSLLAEYPAWHEQPLSLTVSEIENPGAVLSFFFTCYNLPDIRACLKELLHDSLRADGADACSHVSTHKDLEKLVEAAWIIHQQKEKGGNNTSHEAASSSLQQAIKVFEKKRLTGSYKSIHSFFTFFTLPQARKYLSSAIKAAESETVWDKSTPTDLLAFFEDFDKLVDAVFAVIKEGKKIKEVVLINTEDSINPAHTHFYCGSFDHHQPWDYFPRNLSCKEYCNPYKALQKFTAWASKKEWKENLRDILSYALGKGSLSEMGINMELVQMTELLLKMLEASHIINARLHFQKSDPKQEK